MNKSLIFIFIIVFLVKTGNVFSNSNIFDVDNIYINKDSSKSREQLLNLSFKKGFNKLINKILINKDIDIVLKTSLTEIKNLVSTYQIIEEKDNLDSQRITVNLKFNREKINSFFYSKNVSYADISKTKLLLFPVLIKDDNFYLYSKNYFHLNWNNKLDENSVDEFIEYILPVENLDDIRFIDKNKNNLESVNTEILLSSYDIKNYLFLIISPSLNNNKIYLKGKISGKAIVKNIEIKNYEKNVEKNNKNFIYFMKQEINEIWKKQNLIDVKTPSFLNVYLEIGNINNLQKLQAALNKIDIIENHNVLELTKNYAKISIKYLGKIDKIKLKFIEQKIDINIQDNEWKLKLS